MPRQQLIQSLKPGFRSTIYPTSRAFSTTIIRMGEGDTGGMRSGGAAQSDSFQKREAADENYYVRQREMEKLHALKQKIAEHQKHLDELDKNVTDQINSGKK